MSLCDSFLQEETDSNEMPRPSESFENEKASTSPLGHNTVRSQSHSVVRPSPQGPSKSSSTNMHIRRRHPISHHLEFLILIV